MSSFFAHVVEEVGIYGHHFRLARKVFKLVYRPLIPHRQTVNIVNERAAGPLPVDRLVWSGQRARRTAGIDGLARLEQEHGRIYLGTRLMSDARGTT